VGPGGVEPVDAREVGSAVEGDAVVVVLSKQCPYCQRLWPKLLNATRDAGVTVYAVVFDPASQLATPDLAFVISNIVQPAFNQLERPGVPALLRFQASEDEMTGVTVFAKEIPRWSGLAEIMVRGKDVRTRVEFGHVQRDLHLDVRTLEYRSTWERVWYRATAPGRRIVFNLQMYPGWTAYIYDASGQRLQRAGWLCSPLFAPLGLNQPLNGHGGRRDSVHVAPWIELS